jgi:DNA repair protein RadD
MPNLFDTPIELFPLRPRQEAAIDGIRQAIREGHKRIILQAPTGAGKTILASHIIAGALDKGKHPLFTVPQVSLIDQTIRRLEAQGISDIGVIQAQHSRTDGSARVQIASVQTLVRRPLPNADFVLIDEIHLQFAALNKILDSEEWKDKVVIGLSATPWSKGMGRRWTKLVPFGTTNELIAEGWLTPLVAYGVPDEYAPDVSKVHTNFDGDYVESEAADAMSTQQIIGNVVRTWKEKGPGDKTFMFCVNRVHAKKMQHEFEAAGFPCGYIDGSMDSDQRETVFKKYRSGEYKLISSVGCLVVGVDEDVRCIIFLVLTKSEMKWVQAGGRGLRLADGKEHLLLLDHAGTCEALGLFTDIHHEALDMHDPNEKGQPFSDRKPPKPSKCPRCNSIVSKGKTACPVCGAILVSTKSPRTLDGELVQVGSKKTKEKVEKIELPRSQWYGGLLWIAHERGYSEGWAAHKYREKFGNWPNGMAKVATQPHPEVIKFERYIRIRNAKSRQKSVRVPA